MRPKSRRADATSARRTDSTSARGSWEAAGDWYDKLVGGQGHYYHRAIILPETLKWLEATRPIQGLIDLGCGQGVLARALKQDIPYLGVDSAHEFIEMARRRSPNHRFQCADLSQEWTSAPSKTFSHACLLLALQNMPRGHQVLLNAARCLQPNGHLLIALNHPCFRIPRQSSWHIDETQNRQSRRIDSYMTPMEIPLTVHPSRTSPKEGATPKSPETWSFHTPLSTLMQWLNASGFSLIDLKEWVSDRSSTGAHARRENRARAEFPLFLALHCRLTHCAQ